MIKFQISAKLYPTEEQEKITTLFSLFYDFPNIEVHEPDSNQVRVVEAFGEGKETLHYLFHQIRQQKTVEAVRKQVLHRMDLNHQEVRFYIHKQALMKNKVVICKSPEDSPLGPIIIKITANDIESTINYLFPPTQDGKVLEVNYELED